MSARDWIEVILSGLLVLNLIVLSAGTILTMRGLQEFSSRLRTLVDRMERELTTTLQEAGRTTQRLSELSQSLTQLVNNQVVPTAEVARSALSHVEVTLKGVADATSSVRRLAAGVEALTAPSAVSGAIERATASPTGKAALIAAGVLALLKGVLLRPRGSTPQNK